jgi:hypothetical protein
MQRSRRRLLLAISPVWETGPGSRGRARLQKLAQQRGNQKWPATCCGLRRSDRLRCVRHQPFYQRNRRQKSCRSYLGSLAFGALPRIVLAAAKCTDESEAGAPRILTRAKSNVGPSGGGYGYDLEVKPLSDRPDVIATRSFGWNRSTEPLGTFWTRPRPTLTKTKHPANPIRPSRFSSQP